MNYSKTAHEAERKRLRQLQREIVIDWASLARESMAAFARDTGRILYSTQGRRLRVLDGGKLHPLTHLENCGLWTIVRDGLERRGCKLSCKIIRAGLKAISLMAPMPGEVAR